MLEIFLWLNGLILLLVLVAGLSLQLPAVQTFLAQKATDFLASKLNTKVSIGRFTTDWRNSIVLKEIYLEDQQKDTLLYAGRLGLDLNIFSLKSNRLKLRAARIENGKLHINSNPSDSTYNFDFILKAFASGGTDTTRDFSFAIRNLKLKNIRLRLNDPVGGNSGTVVIGQFEMDADRFDTSQETFDLGKLSLKDSRVFWLKTKAGSEDGPTKEPKVVFDKIKIENLRLEHHDKVESRRMLARIGSSELGADKIALEDLRADLNKFTLKDSEFIFYQHKFSEDTLAGNATKPEPKTAVVAPKPKVKKDWAVWLQKLDWQNIHFRYRDFNAAPKKQGLDFNYLHITGINLGIENIYYSQKRITGIVKQMQARDKSGFRILNVAGNLKAGPEFITFSKFELKTNASILRSGLHLNFGSRKSRKDLASRISFVLNLNAAVITPRDMLYFVPDLAMKPTFRKLANRPLLISGNVTGKDNILQLRSFRFKGWSGTNLHLNGKVQHVTNAQNRTVALNLLKFNTNNTDLNLLLGKGNEKPAINLPEKLSLTGNIQNRLGRLSFQNLEFKASNGTYLHTNGQITGVGKEQHFDLDVKKFQSNRGALLAMFPPGTVTPEVELPDRMQFIGHYKGSSLDQFALNGNFQTSFGNAYTNIKIEPVDRFSGHISLDNFELGKFLKQEKMLGAATGKADFNGRGFKVNTMELHYKANVKKFVYKKDTYRNIRLEGDLNKKIYQLHGNLANAALQGLGHKLKNIKPKNLDLKKADPTRLIPKKIEPKKIVPKFLRKKKKKEEEEKK